jgi:hypothetical protein
MGMQQKLQKAFDEGRKQGLKEAQPFIELKGAADGAAATWELIEEMIPQLEGIGPKTKEKIFKAVQAYANAEKEKIRRG